MCENKTVWTAAALQLAAGFSIYQVISEKEMGHNSHLKRDNLCDKVYIG